MRSLEGELARVIGEARGFDAAADGLLRAVAEAVGGRAALLWLVGGPGARPRCAATWAADDRAARFASDRAAAAADGLLDEVRAAGGVRWSADVCCDPGLGRPDEALAADLVSGVWVPVLEEEAVAGVIEAFAGEELELDRSALAALLTAGAYAGQLLRRVRADEAISAGQAHTRAILEASVDAIVSSDSTGRIIEANRAAERLFGFPPGGLVGQNVEVLVAPDLRAAHRAGLAGAAAGGPPRILGRRVELTGVRAGGAEFPVELTVVRVEGVEPPVFTAFIRDISERQAAERERLELLAGAQAARASTEAAWRRLRLVSNISELLAVSFDYPHTFVRLAQRVVQDLADICLIDIVGEAGAIERVAAVHRDPHLQPLTDRLGAEYAPKASGPHPVAGVLATAAPLHASEMTDEFLRATCQDEEHYELVKTLGFTSYVTVPLIARQRMLGTLTLISTTPEHRYDRTDVAVAEEIARRAAVRIDNARLYHERDRIAHVLQQGLLPDALVAAPGMTVAARYVPAGEGIEAGGDFYDAFRIDEGTWALAIGDVLGKGPEAAAVMGLARWSLLASARARPRSPARLLEALNDILLDHTDTRRFCTVAVAALKPSAGGIDATISLGGHEPALIVRGDGTVRPFGRLGAALGIVAGPEFHEHTETLRPGDLLALHTDGLTEGRGRDPREFEQMLCELLVHHRGEPPDAIAASIERHLIADLRSDHPVRDDVALLIAKLG
jgi:PAS domain S-box-containing protein